MSKKRVQRAAAVFSQCLNKVSGPKCLAASANVAPQFAIWNKHSYINVGSDLFVYFLALDCDKMAIYRIVTHGQRDAKRGHGMTCRYTDSIGHPGTDQIDSQRLKR